MDIKKVKQGLECCLGINGVRCSKCDYWNSACERELKADALKLINHLSEELDFEKSFNSNLLEAVAQKRQICASAPIPQDSEWIPCSKQLPKAGQDILLYFNDTYHTDPSWSPTAVQPAWRCNIDETTPNGQWAIEGRLWHTTVIDIEDGIAWMPLPHP